MRRIHYYRLHTDEFERYNFLNDNYLNRLTRITKNLSL